jgi:hypothetical protein
MFGSFNAFSFLFCGGLFFLSFCFAFWLIKWHVLFITSYFYFYFLLPLFYKTIHVLVIDGGAEMPYKERMPRLYHYVPTIDEPDHEPPCNHMTCVRSEH